MKNQTLSFKISGLGVMGSCRWDGEGKFDEFGCGGFDSQPSATADAQRVLTALRLGSIRAEDYFRCLDSGIADSASFPTKEAIA